MTRPTPAEFVRQVRQEVGKVNWPSRKETMISTTMVLVMTGVAAVFFLAVDSIIATAVKYILGLGA